jgi:DNA repair protein RecO (recombination protein O)
MAFVDDAFVLTARAHGETHAVVEIFAEGHGRRAGLVYGGQGRRMRPILQPGNEVRADWKGRGDGLGFFSLELTHARAAALMQDRFALAGLAAVCAVAAATLPESEPHARIYRSMRVLFDHFGDVELWPPLLARFELGLLAELGFGLSLERCAATGARDNLAFVSPKSACAVSAAAGEPYRDKLLPLPPFLIDAGAPASVADALAALTTTGYFIETRVLHALHREMPDARRRLIDLLVASIRA